MPRCGRGPTSSSVKKLRMPCLDPERVFRDAQETTLRQAAAQAVAQPYMQYSSEANMGESKKRGRGKHMRTVEVNPRSIMFAQMTVSEFWSQWGLPKPDTVIEEALHTRRRPHFGPTEVVDVNGCLYAVNNRRHYVDRCLWAKGLISSVEIVKLTVDFLHGKELNAIHKKLTNVFDGHIVKVKEAAGGERESYYTHDKREMQPAMVVTVACICRQVDPDDTNVERLRTSVWTTLRKLDKHGFCTTDSLHMLMGFLASNPDINMDLPTNWILKLKDSLRKPCWPRSLIDDAMQLTCVGWFGHLEEHAQLGCTCVTSTKKVRAQTVVVDGYEDPDEVQSQSEAAWPCVRSHSGREGPRVQGTKRKAPGEIAGGPRGSLATVVARPTHEATVAAQYIGWGSSAVPSEGPCNANVSDHAGSWKSKRKQTPGSLATVVARRTHEAAVAAQHSGWGPSAVPSERPCNANVNDHAGSWQSKCPRESRDAVAASIQWGGNIMSAIAHEASSHKAFRRTHKEVTGVPFEHPLQDGAQVRCPVSDRARE